MLKTYQKMIRCVDFSINFNEELNNTTKLFFSNNFTPTQYLNNSGLRFTKFFYHHFLFSAKSFMEKILVKGFDSKVLTLVNLSVVCGG
jgi:hypothetical protein